MYVPVSTLKTSRTVEADWFHQQKTKTAEIKRLKELLLSSAVEKGTPRPSTSTTRRVNEAFRAKEYRERDQTNRLRDVKLGIKEEDTFYQYLKSLKPKLCRE